MVQPAAEATSPPRSQPVANAELNIALCWAREVEPSVIVHDGMSTSESRGIETTSARLRSAERCTTMVVSERMPTTPAVPPMTPFSPSRSSEPRMRMLTARPACGSLGSGVVVAAVGVGAGPAREIASATVTLLWRRPRAAATPAVLKARTATTVSAATWRTRWVRGAWAWRGMWARTTMAWRGITHPRIGRVVRRQWVPRQRFGGGSVEVSGPSWAYLASVASFCGRHQASFATYHSMVAARPSRNER